jgi:hypothetical protein
MAPVTRAALAVLLAAAAAAGCGSSAGLARVLPGPAGRLNPIYDLLIEYPDTTLVIGGLEYRGLAIEVEMEFADASVRDADPLYAAEARVVEVRAGGLPQAFALPGPLNVEGTIEDDAVAVPPFGPIRVGTANLFPELTGVLADGRRRFAGDAGLYGTAERGAFLAIKRRRYLVAGTDFQAFGKVAEIAVRFDTRFAVRHDLELISADPVARVEDGRPLVVNRYTFDNLQGFDPATFVTTFEHSVGNGANPHDAVLLSPAAAGVPEAPGDHPGFAFVTRYEPPFDDLAVVDLESGDVVDRIDLRPYARNPDATPRADQIAAHDGLLWVTLQDANRGFTEFQAGRVAVVDPAARRVVDIIDLPGQNPFESLVYAASAGRFYLNLAGIFPGIRPQALTGGIAVVDPETRTASLLLDDDLLGGNVAAVAVDSAARAFCVVSDASFRNSVRVFDPATGEPGAVLYESADLIAAIETDGDGWLLVAETNFFEPRVLIFDAATGAPVAVLPAHLAPLSIAVLTRSL